jgi:hypothetical protein
MAFTIKKAILAATISVSTMNVQATPVQFSFTSKVINANISGVSDDDVVTINLIADNGASDLISQSWTIGDLISGSLSAGSYTQSYIDGWFSSDTHLAFQTDASGNLTLTEFYGTTTSANHQDSFGTGLSVYLYSNAFQDLYGNITEYVDRLPTSANWTVSQVTQVPEPENLAMLLAGLGLLGLASGRNKQE